MSDFFGKLMSSFLRACKKAKALVMMIDDSLVYQSDKYIYVVNT